MEFTETEEQKMIREMVRKFAQNEVKPLSFELDKKLDPNDCFSWELVKKSKEWR